MKRRVAGIPVLYVGHPNSYWRPFRVHEIRKTYRNASDLRDFASQLQLDPKQARKLLELAGIDYLWRLQKAICLATPVQRLRSEMV